MSSFRTLLALAPTLALAACFDGGDEPLSAREVQEALQAVAVSNAGEALTGEAVEISTSFTLGDAWDQAVENTRAFYESQIPCSTVTASDRTVTIDFGDLSDLCTYNGRTYAGVQTLTVARIDAREAEVVHGFAGFTNGLTTLDGTATVTWNLTEKTRHVVHEADWTNLDGEVLTATGDRTQSLVAAGEGVGGGIQIDGERGWLWKGGAWSLDIDGVQVRPQDPVPQAGSYVLTTPSDKTLTMTFERLDGDTIEVIVDGGRQTRTYHVTSTGQVSDETDAA